MAIIVYPEDQAAGMAVVTRVLEQTEILAEVKGSDITELARFIASGIVRDRIRIRDAAAADAAAAKPSPTLIPGPGASVPHG